MESYAFVIYLPYPKTAQSVHSFGSTFSFLSKMEKALIAFQITNYVATGQIINHEVFQIIQLELLFVLNMMKSIAQNIFTMFSILCQVGILQT